MKRLERLISMALALAAQRRVRASDLSKQFSISERTVYRDVRALASAGFPVEGSSGDGYRVPSSAFLKPLGLDEAEAVALAMGATMLSPSADAALRDTLSSAEVKLESVLGPTAKQRLRRFRAETHVSQRARRPGGPLGVVADSLGAREVLAIAYDPASGGPMTRREVEPLGLVLAGSSWLLIAYCRLRQDVRGFRVDGIRDVRRTGERYSVRPNFSFAEVVEREQRRRLRPS
jgi:predicted DNA-binding transcriptional regulator YafY